MEQLDFFADLSPTPAVAAPLAIEPPQQAPMVQTEEPASDVILDSEQSADTGTEGEEEFFDNEHVQDAYDQGNWNDPVLLVDFLLDLEYRMSAERDDEDRRAMCAGIKQIKQRLDSLLAETGETIH